MEYEGKLYGKVRGKYFDTGKTSMDLDNLEKQIAELKTWILKTKTVVITTVCEHEWKYKYDKPSDYNKCKLCGLEVGEQTVL